MRWVTCLYEGGGRQHGPPWPEGRTTVGLDAKAHTLRHSGLNRAAQISPGVRGVFPAPYRPGAERADRREAKEMLLAVATFAPRNNGHVSNPTSPQRVPTRQTKTGRDSNNAAAIQARAQPGMIVHND